MAERSFVSQFGQDSIQPQVATERTMGGFATFALWLGANMVITTVMTGTLMVPDLSLSQVLAAVLMGSLIGGVPLVLFATAGQITGLPSMTLTRGAFGIKGANVASWINVITLIGWAWIQAQMAGMSMNYAVNHLFGFDNLALFTIIAQGIVVFLAIYGHRGIEWAEKITAMAMLVLTLAIFYKMATAFDLRTAFHYTPDPSVHGITFAIAFDLAVATAISWASSSADYNRNCPTRLVSWLGTLGGYVTASLLAMGLGAVIGVLSTAGGGEGTYDPTVLLANSGYGMVAALVVLLSVLTTNLLAVYSATLSFLNIFPKISFWKPALTIGLITVFGALVGGLLDKFMSWILLIGTVFMPMFAIFIADFYILARCRYAIDQMMDESPRSRYWYSGGYNLKALISYFLSAGIAYYLTYIRPLPFGSTVVSFLIALVLYLAISRVTAGSGQRRDTAA